MKKPQDIYEYQQWLKEKHGIEFSERDRTYYESVAIKIKRDFEQSPFWAQLVGQLQNFEEDYLLSTSYNLLIPNFRSVVKKKPFDSFFLKTFRINILENKNWPNAPDGEWILPNNWYSEIDDIVRTLFIVKYMDGVEFLLERIKSFCEQNNIEFRAELKAKEEGYYAAHIHITHSFAIPGKTLDTKKINIPIEIQITTQIQEVLRKLLHKYYEERRKGVKGKDIKWQWDYDGEEFAVNYLGHILHYVEGMIMEIRNKQKEEKSWKKK